MEKRLYYVHPRGGGVWDVMANSAEDAISEIAQEIYGGDDSGLTAEIAPKGFMIYENGNKMSAMQAHTEQEAIEQFVSFFRNGDLGSNRYTAMEILNETKDGDDGLG